MRLPSRRVLIAPALAGGVALAGTPVALAAPADTSAGTSAATTKTTATTGTIAAPASTTRADARYESVVNLTVKPMWSGANEQLFIDGEVYDGRNYRPLTGRRIVLQSRIKGTSTWRNLAIKESNNNGAFRHIRRADRSRDYRAIYSGNSWFQSDQSGWQRQTTHDGIKVRTSARLYEIGSGSAVRGRLTQLWSSTVKPLKGANVTIEARRPYGTYWFTAGSTKTNHNGYYTWNTSIEPQQCYRYRAIYKGNYKYAAKSKMVYWSSCS